MLRFIKGESHRGVVCLKKLTKETHGAKHKYDKTPTTGFSTLLYLTRQCDCVTVFGFMQHDKLWSRFGMVGSLGSKRMERPGA